jgi:hypothetical protein
VSTIGDVLDEVVADLAAVGWEAVRTPDLVLPTLSQSGRVAFVGLPTVVGRGVSGTLALEIPVHLACVPTAPGYESMLDLIPATVRRFGVAQELAPQSLRMDDTELPGYLLTITRRTPC